MSSLSQSPVKRLGNFELVDEIGQGGMGVVYLARQPALERSVVLKKIRRDLLGDPRAIQRFQSEARAAAAVHHQNVVAVYDCFTHRGDYYIAQELVDGVDLQQVLAHAGKLEPRIATLVALEVIRGLEEIHARGIVHRDLKPANILIGSGGEIKIADFGIAIEGDAERLTHPGTLLGSVPYMSPEQMQGRRVDYRSDLFSFGVVLYEMLAGHSPFLVTGDDSTEALLECIERERIVPLRVHARGVPRYLSRLVRRCLRARPARRVASATLVRRRLERRLAGIPAAESRREIAEFLWRRGLFREAGGKTECRRVGSQGRPRRRPLMLVTAAVCLLVLAGVGYAVRNADDARQPSSWSAADSSAVPQPSRSENRAPSIAPIARPLAPAQVRFVASPWAEVRLADGRSFTTPRAGAIELQPGLHTVRFEHPRFGAAEYRLQLDAGEQRVLHHEYRQQTPRREGS